MKSIVVPIIILIIIIVLIVSNSILLNITTKSLSDKINDAVKYTQADDYVKSKEAIEEYFEQYEKAEAYFSVVIRHAELDSIRVMSERVKEFNTSETKADFLAESAALIDMIKHLYTAESINLKNIM